MSSGFYTASSCMSNVFYRMWDDRIRNCRVFTYRVYILLCVFDACSYSEFCSRDDGRDNTMYCIYGPGCNRRTGNPRWWWWWWCFLFYLFACLFARLLVCLSVYVSVYHFVGRWTPKLMGGFRWIYTIFIVLLWMISFVYFKYFLSFFGYC